MDQYQNNQNQDPYYPDPVPPYSQPPKGNNILAIFSMVTGLFSILGCCISFFSFPLSIAGITLAILSKKGKPFSGFAIAGLILSIIGLVACIIFFVYLIIIMDLMKTPEYNRLFNEILKEYYNAMP